MRATLGSFRSTAAALAAVAAMAIGAAAWDVDAVPTDSPSGEPDVASFEPITPCRLADTRPGPFNTGDRLGPVGAGETVTFDAHGINGDCDLSSSAVALVLNITAVGATAPTNLRVFPTGEATPTVSNLNPVPGQPPTPNAATVALSSGGQFDLLNAFGSVNVIIDVIGSFEPDPTTRTERVSVSGTAFRPNRDYFEYDVSASGASITGPSPLNGSVMYAPLDLPDGAVLDSATATFSDGSLVYDLGIEVICDSLDGAFVVKLFTYESSGTQGLTTVEMAQPEEHTVDNERCAYAARAFEQGWTVAGTSLAIKGVSIELTTPR